MDGVETWRARLQVAQAALRCTRAEALALTVLLAGAVAVTGLVWWRSTPGPAAPDRADPDLAETRVSDGAEPTEPATSPTGEVDPGELDAGQLDGGSDAAGEAVVHVAGEVTEPGLVTVDADARVAEALEAAGGVTADADVDALNLARTVADGEQLHVPHVDDGVPPGEGAGPSGAVDADGVVDVNRADAAELETVPGIGPVTAERIIAHREEHGPFAAVEELLEVSGIGERTLEQLADHLRV